MHCNPDVRIVHRGKSKRLSAQERKLLERRQAIEPIIGHLKADHRMDRCHLKGETGDRLHAVLCAAGYNIRWLLRMIAKKGIRALLALLLRLLRLAKAGAISLRPGLFDGSLAHGFSLQSSSTGCSPELSRLSRLLAVSKSGQANPLDIKPTPTIVASASSLETSDVA
jgi:hypothetical protein